MSAWTDFAERARALFMRGREERDMEDEISFHLEMETRRNIEAGIPPLDARRIAERTLGGSDQVKENVRDARGTRVIEEVWRDATHAVRTLVRQPQFTAIMLLILALGIGANATTFTLVDALLLQQLPVHNADKLISVGNPARPNSMSNGTPRLSLISYPLYRDLRENSTGVLDGLYATGRSRADVLVPGAKSTDTPEHPRSRFVSENYFDVLGVSSWAGRLLTQADDGAPGADPYVVVSYDYWQHRLAGDRSVLGRTMIVNNVPLTIIGIAPPSFGGDVVGQPTDMWLPLKMQPVLMPNTPLLEERASSWLLLMGRLRDNVTVDRARDVLQRVADRSLLEHAGAGEVGAIREIIAEEPLQVEAGARGFSYYRTEYARALITLMVAVGLVLLVVCANVANLMLVRAVGRSREMGIRMAIGAGRGHLVRQMLTESAVLALAGGMLGLLAAQWGSTALLKLAGGSSPIPIALGINGHILFFTAALSLGTAMLFGLVPAVRATRVSLTSTLRAQGRGVMGSGGGAGRLPLGKLLVVAQVALSMVLLVGTSMLARSVARLQSSDIGVDRDHLVVVGVDAAKAGYRDARLATLTAQLREALIRVPGVTAVTMSENGIFSGTESGTTLQMEGFTANAPDDTVVAYDDVEPGYFAAVGAHIVQGREFEPHDNETAPRVAVVNETMSRFYYPRGDVMGRRIRVDSSSYTIVGVVKDIEEQGMREKPARRMYVPMSQLDQRAQHFNIEIRTAGKPESVVEQVRTAVRGVDPSLAILGIDPLPSLIRDSINQDRLVARVTTFFGALALLLTALGLYGVMTYNTTRRVSEFGLRIALGARPADVTGMMLREAMALMLAGVVIGIPAALGATRLLRSQIFGIGMFDATSLGIAVAVLAVSAAIAGGLPALRASRSSPLVALNTE